MRQKLAVASKGLDISAKRRVICWCGCFLIAGTVSIALMAIDSSFFSSLRIDHVMRSSVGMVVAAHPQAAAAGAQILAQGGNATDAAVGTAFALSVVEPEASGLGGGGFFLLYDKAMGSCVSLDYRETAPRGSTDTMFSMDGSGLAGHWDAPQTEAAREALQRYGGQGVGVPRMVAGLLQAHTLYGRLPLAEVLEPAIRLAEDGFTVSSTLYSAVLNIYDVLLANDAMAAAFLNDDFPYEPGETAYRPDLAATLREIAAHGADAFYRGAMAADIVRAVQAAGGILELDDLDSVTVEVDEPMDVTYRGVRLVTPPPPAGGLTVFETLRILEGFDLDSMSLDSADAIHLMAEAAKRAFADRRAYVGDPASIDVPIRTLLSDDWADLRRASILLDRATSFPDPGALESSSTSHVSVIDADGNAVSLTQSINLFFGSRVFVPEWGLLMNNTMSDFDPEPGGPNSVAPGKIPASSMSPMFLFDSSGLLAVLGSPGSTRIISTLVGLIVQFVDWHVPLADAIQAPRFHAETDTLYIEPRLGDGVLETLEGYGHAIERKGAYDLYFGGAHVIEIQREGTNTWYLGAADPRRAGQAAGL
jgi:gamma-glutamyltranspeptidase / glutathione hydrolase